MRYSDHRLIKTMVSRAIGFSLVELLVVIAIITILIALLLPAVQSARETARRIQCGNNVRQLALAVLHHEAMVTFFPTGGWYQDWVGHPDRGFGKKQPGGWIYNLLPFIEQQPLHDLGTPGSGISIEDANRKRIGTALPGFNCPTRRNAELFKLRQNTISFKLTTLPITEVARSDYAMNGGDYPTYTNEVSSPADFVTADQRKESDWDNMLNQTGVCYQRSQVTMVDIDDGTSNTFLIGEKYVDFRHYFDGMDCGDNGSMYSGDDLNLLRWTGVSGAVGTSSLNNLPRQDSSIIGAGSSVQWFGSAHSNSFNISFCDGSVRSINYSIDGQTYRRLGNRKDSLPIDGGQL
jgi:prepilin-type N-terminal cleavage/methylation domain-containing protein/prepilin-type processing-associated H-X9-DG protein